MDELDRKLLILLQNNSQAPLAELSASLGLSSTALHHRIQKLKKSGTIRRFTIQIDPSKGERDLAAFVSIVKHKKSSIEIAQKLKAIPQVESCYSVTGEVSLTAKVRFRDPRELQGVLEKMQKIEGVERTVTTLVIEEHFDRGLCLAPMAEG